MAAELRQASRRLWSSPAFAALAIGMLSVGVGTNAAMLGLVDALLLRPPAHVADPGNVVRVQFRPRTEPSLLTRTDYTAFSDLEQSGAFAGIAAYADATGSMGAGKDATLRNLLCVSRNFFDVLGTRPRLGSFAAVHDGDASSGGWAVISHAFWRQHFGGASTALGAKLTLDARVYTIAAVAPDGFPNLTTRSVDVWVPLDHTATAAAALSSARARRERPWLSVIARLAPGTGRAAAEQRAAAPLHARGAAGGDDSDEIPWDVVTASLVPGRDARMPLESRVSFWLAGVSAILLLIACANVANLVLTRALAQQKEFHIRLALGASRRDLLLRSVAETVLIVAAGGGGALAVSFLLRNSLAGYLPGDVPIPRDLWDLRTAAIVSASAVLALVAIQAASLVGMRGLWRDRERLAARIGGHPAMRPRRVLLAMQAGLSLALLFVAGLFTTSLRRVEGLDLGTDLDRTLQLTITLAPQHRAAAEARAIHQQAIDALSQHPDVERVAVAAGSPFMSGSAVGPRTADRSFDELWAKQPEVAYRSVVGAGFFSTVGTSSLLGRDFAESDRSGAPPVAIVNAPLARHLWPSGNALGQCVWLDDVPSCVQVIGILGGVWKFKAVERNKMAVYLPLAQVPGASPTAVYIRPRGDARGFLPQAVAVVQAVRPDLPAARAVVLRDVVDPEFRPWQMGMTVFSAFAAVALLITAIGLYGVAAAATVARLKEIGIRVALGARWPHVIAAVVGESVVAVAGGLLGGIVLVAAASRWLSAILFQTSVRDPLVVIETAIVLLLVATIAVAAPTVRALRANPRDVLRAE